MAPPRDGEPRIYAVRLATSAGNEIQDEHSRLTAVSGSEIAKDWRDGVREAVRGLATYPERCTVVNAARLGASSSLCMKLTRTTRPQFGGIMSVTARKLR